MHKNIGKEFFGTAHRAGFGGGGGGGGGGGDGVRGGVGSR